MERVPLDHTDGRGRRGWFRARQALVAAAGRRVDLDVVSKRPSFPGPVRLELSRADAVALARALLRAVERAIVTQHD